MSLSSVVELYRACNRPPLADGEFECVTEFSPIRECVQRVRKSGSGDFRHLFVDGEEVLTDPLPERGQQIEFCVRLRTNSSNTFHPSLAELLEIEPRISRGVVPDDFYLVDEDFYSADQVQPSKVQTLYKVCRLIKGLADLAHYQDGRANSPHHFRLVFIQPTEGPRTAPVVLETKVTIGILESGFSLDPSLVETLSESSGSGDPHYFDKVGVFATSLATFVGERPAKVSPFAHLVASWQEFVRGYQRDLSTYLSGFAFHKAKREVAEAELNIAGEFSKVLSEITGQLLSVPVSIAVVLAIPRAESLLERLVLLVGVLVASVVIFKLVRNQRRQLERIKHAKSLVLGAIEGKKEIYPKDLVDSIDAMSLSLKKSEESLDNSLTLFAWLSWAPVIAAALALVYVYSAELRDLFLGIQEWWNLLGY